MNQKELEIKRNRNAQKINNNDSRHRNRVNLHKQNTRRHEMKKAELCWQLEQEGKHYITEARFKNKNLRADIYILDDDELWEIETSKTELSNRKNKYPKEKTYVWPLWDNSPEIVTLNEL